MRIAITGATSLLGRNLLFEIIKQNINDLDKLEIIVLGKEKYGKNLSRRIIDIFEEEGRPLFPKAQIPAIQEYFAHRIECVDMCLDREDLGISQGDVQRLHSAPIDFFFHIAAITDFSDSPQVKEKLDKVNVLGTQSILKLISSLKVGEFCYVSTAYSCGETAGRIMPDYTNPDQKFRNYYEASKSEAETYVQEFCKNNGLHYRIFKPSVICGRLMEPPLGSTYKFDVFYAWAAFFLNMKKKEIKDKSLIYETPVTFDVRIRVGERSGLNIVPADYAAKVMYQVCIQNACDNSFHLVNNQDTPCNLFMSLMIHAINIQGIQLVENIPGELNFLESFYYNSIGKRWDSYVNMEKTHFDTENLVHVLQKARLSCPPVNESNFQILMDYAKSKNFGLKNLTV
ncbi:MAG TPA: SDR family oxidoreductase [Candidatus Wunengus sp. YC63]|uniref:SDR family oxidoreductase n=1 Tax=Candidatus Wunengus sp. YC63 TaxID=3367699 RepID=UPI00402774A1